MDYSCGKRLTLRRDDSCNPGNALLYRAVYKTSAVKFLVQLTEGPLPTRKWETEHIDYAAGLVAKELLMKKLERG